MLRRLLFTAGAGYLARKFMGGRRNSGSRRSGFGSPLRRRGMMGF